MKPKTSTVNAEWITNVQQEMQEIADLLFAWNWVDTTGGSLSVRLADSPEYFALTPTHSGFRRWKLVPSGLVILDASLQKSEASTSWHVAHPSAIIHSFLYENLPLAHSIIHTHSPYSLAFACRGADIPPCTLHSKILGNVPCLQSDADEVSDRSTAFLGETEEEITSGIMGYRYAYAHFESLLDEIKSKIIPRGGELARHGLAFTVYKHGIFIAARNLSEAFDNLVRVERNAQVQMLTRLAVPSVNV